MTRLGWLAFLAAFLFWIGATAQAYEQTDRYTHVTLHGWHVLIAPEIDARPKLKAAMLRSLDGQLATLRNTLSPKALRHMTRASIWLELQSKTDDGFHLVGQYFTFKTYLRKRGLNPDKFESVQLNALFAKDGPNGTTAFHELAHVYHDLRFGHSNRMQKL